MSVAVFIWWKSCNFAAFIHQSERILILWVNNNTVMYYAMHLLHKIRIWSWKTMLNLDQWAASFYLQGPAWVLHIWSSFHLVKMLQFCCFYPSVWKNLASYEWTIIPLCTKLMYLLHQIRIWCRKSMSIGINELSVLSPVGSKGPACQ